MEWKAGTKLHGFKLVREDEVREINARALLFEHIKTGARLLWLASDEDNKVFSIAFRTPPPDNTGLPHILEHAVLCGSRKFTGKEPFVELVRGSLNTFLNAMTYADKTVYPVASRNHKDFRNLIDVYLDAVFFPAIYHRPEVFRQEGWHYQIDSPEQELTINGVVYNEMRGVFSSPGNLLQRKVMQALFPDNMYGFESGGVPDAIPELTYEKFLEFHRQHYHPGNAWLFVYGDAEIAETLAFIDSEYLSRFERRREVVKLPRQPAFDQKHNLTAEFAVPADEKSDGKSILSLSWVVGDTSRPDVTLAFAVLGDILVDNEAGIIKRALLEQGIGREITVSLDTTIQQPVFTIAAWDARIHQQAEFEAVIYDCLTRLVERGISSKLLQASLSYHEFRLREADFLHYPKGLVYNLRCLGTWLYDHDPLLPLKYEPVLAKLKKEIEEGSGYFTGLISKYLLENTHCAAVTLRPRPGLEEKRAGEKRRKLAEIKDRIKEPALRQLIDDCAALKRFQETPDSAADLATIPSLSLGDLERQSPLLSGREITVEGLKVLFLPLFTNRIAYTSFYFDCRVVPQNLLPYLYLLADLLSRIDTGRHRYGELDMAIKRHTGGLSFDVCAFADVHEAGTYCPKFIVRGRSLINHLPQMCELIGEILADSRFNDPERLRELIRELRTNLRENMFDNGRKIITARLLSYFSPAGRFNEYGEFSYYRFLCKLDDDYRDMARDIETNLQQVAAMVFDRNRLLIGLTCAERDLEFFRQSMVMLVTRLNDQPLPAQACDFVLSPANEGFALAARVQHIVKGYDFRRLGVSYHGSLKVVETILQYEYLWNKIRVLGGAYGPLVRISPTGETILGSYRDPQLTESLRVFDGTGGYLRQFSAGSRDMERYIIGTIGRLDSPLTPAMKGERFVTLRLQNRSDDDIQRERDEVLATTVAGVRKWADMFDAVAAANHLCVIGSEPALLSARHLFGNIVRVNNE
ncbi:MAG: insulinase family protein [Negativicutes bacterium]|nr:insulinase family protein [Negativicutes bacterium]